MDDRARADKTIDRDPGFARLLPPHFAAAGHQPFVVDPKKPRVTLPGAREPGVAVFMVDVAWRLDAHRARSVGGGRIARGNARLFHTIMRIHRNDLP